MNRRTIEHLNIELRSIRWIFRHSVFAALLFCCSEALSQTNKVDSLQSLLQTNLHDTTRIKTLNTLAWKLKYTNPDTAIVLSNRALELAVKNEDMKGQASAFRNLGVFSRLKGNYPKALEHYHKALKINEKLKDRRGISASLSSIGIVYRNQGDSTVAAGDTALAMADTYPKALEYYFKALKMDEEMDNKSGIAADLGNIGIVYRNQGDYPKALEYYFKALKMRKELGAKNLIASALGNIGSLYTKTGRFAEAENYLLRSLAIADTIGSLDDIRVGHQNLSHLYDTTACYQLAYEHYKAYSAAKDTLFNEEKSKDLGKLEAKHEMEMAESKRKQLEKEELKLEDERVNRRNLLQYSGALIFIVALFITILFSGRLNIPVRLAEGGVFFTFLLFFEFTLVLLDPYIEEYSSGAPAIKLGFNALLAGLIFPLHSFAETKLKKRMFNM